METNTKWMIGIGAVAAAGIAYYLWQKSKAATAAALGGPPAPGGSLPAQNAATFTPPVTIPPTMTPAASSTGVQRPPLDFSALQNATRQVMMQPVRQGVFVPGGGMPPMPTGIRGADGFFYTWSPISAGTMVQNPDTGTWISNMSKTQAITINTPLRSHPGAPDGRPSTQVVLPPGYIYSLDTGTVRT